MLYAHALDTHLWWLRNTVDVYNTDTKWIFLHTGTVFTPQEVLKKKKILSRFFPLWMKVWRTDRYLFSPETRIHCMTSGTWPSILLAVG